MANCVLPAHRDAAMSPPLRSRTLAKPASGDDEVVDPDEKDLRVTGPAITDARRCRTVGRHHVAVDVVPIDTFDVHPISSE